MKRAGTPQERALAQMKLKAAATASRSAALFQKSVASASESRPQSKRGKKKAKKKRLYKRPKAWAECWIDVRKKQDAFSQKWKVWPAQVPRRAVTLLGTCLYVEPNTAKASNGWWAPSRTICLGEENEKIDQIPPEWLTSPPNKYEKHIKAAAKEEDWLLEVSVERKMKALCRASNALEIFNQYDDDGSGELDGDEFRAMMAHIGEDLSEEKIENLLAALDPSGDGAVDFDEFKQFITRRDKVGISQSREFCGSYAVSFKDQLLKLYDPKKVAPKFHPLYTLKALCKRESLKFDPSIRRHLNVLWKEIDEDKSGRIEYDEYVPMHRRCCEIMVSLTKIEVQSISGKKVNVGTGLPPKLLTRDGKINHEEHEKLAQEDWEIDNGGMGFLDYERFASCWCRFSVLHAIDARRLASMASVTRRFQIADQFTDKIALEEYESFLGRIVEQVVPEEPEEEPIPRRSSIDSLISHLRNEEVEEIVTDVFEEMSYEVWVSNLGAVLTTIAKDEKPVEEIFVSITPRKLRTRVEVIVAKANTEGTAGSMEEKFLDLSYYAIQIQRVMRGKRGRRRWKDRLARWVRRSQDLLTSALRAQSTRRGILGRRAADEERNRQDELLRKAREARELRKLRELSALKIQCYHRRARAIQLLLRMRRLAQAKAGPVVCDLAELETFFDEEPIVPVQSVMPVFSFTLLPPEIKIPVVVQEPAFDHEAERLRILEEMRRAEEALELDRKAAARAAAEAARENERRAKERLRIALEAFTTGRSQKIVNRFLIKYVIEPYRWRKEQERWKANRAKRARPSIFRGGYWSDLSDEEEPEVEEVVEARPKKEMPCADCGGRVVCVCAEERYRRKELLRRKKLRPTDAEKEEAFRHKAANAGELVEIQQKEIARIAREAEQRKAYQEKFSAKKKKGVLSLPHIVGAEDAPEDSLMKFFASRDGPPSAGDQWYTLENVKEQQSRSDRFKRNLATSRRLKQATGEIELSVRDKMIYRTLTAPVLPPRPWSSQIDDHGRAPSYKRAMTSGSMVPLDGSGRW